MKYSIFSKKTDNKPNDLNEFRPRLANKNDKRNIMLDYLIMIHDKLIYIFSTPIII